MSDQKNQKAKLKAHLAQLKASPRLSSDDIRAILIDVLTELTDEKDRSIDGGNF